MVHWEKFQPIKTLWETVLYVFSLHVYLHKLTNQFNLDD